MPTLLCFGFGYCAQHYVAGHAVRFKCVVGTTRTAERAADLAARRYGGRSVEMLVFDGVTATPELLAALEEADALVVSAAPGKNGDPVLAVLADALIAAAPRLKAIVLLSTLSVYGDHAGAWVDETTKPQPALARGDGRLAAEAAWQALGRKRGTPVAVLRLAGIYGPGQNALEDLRGGMAKRIVKPGQVFNRIHVDDIGQAIDAALARRADGIFNVADDEPSPPGDPIAFAADLLEIAPPPEIPFAVASKTMSPMARGFYGECKRARSDKLKRELGVTLRYPTYREGLRALYGEMTADPSFRDARKARAR